jgi:hypothetical protein
MIVKELGYDTHKKSDQGSEFYKNELGIINFVKPYRWKDLTVPMPTYFMSSFISSTNDSAALSFVR